jgi:hypothetical protein
MPSRPRSSERVAGADGSGRAAQVALRAYHPPITGENVMEALPQLWLPILVSSVLIFVASSLIHMVIRWHKADYRRLANEDAVRAAIRAGAPEAGIYVLPFCSEMKDANDPAMVQKFVEGPNGMITLRAPGMPGAGGMLLQWFLFVAFVNTAAAALALYAFGITAGTDDAGFLIGIVSFLVYAGACLPEGIWMGRPWMVVLRHGIDGTIYAAISAATFCWLWP